MIKENCAPYSSRSICSPSALTGWNFLTSVSNARPSRNSGSSRSRSCSSCSSPCPRRGRSRSRPRSGRSFRHSASRGPSNRPATSRSATQPQIEILCSRSIMTKKKKVVSCESCRAFTPHRKKLYGRRKKWLTASCSSRMCARASCRMVRSSFFQSEKTENSSPPVAGPFQYSADTQLSCRVIE